jgi:hypothetical protein
MSANVPALRSTESKLTRHMAQARHRPIGSIHIFIYALKTKSSMEFVVYKQKPGAIVRKVPALRRNPDLLIPVQSKYKAK